ncbi:MAG: YncE family protein [Nitrospiraceae bacterium]
MMKVLVRIPVSRLHGIVTLAAGEGAVWAPGDGFLSSFSTLFRIDQATNQVVAEIRLDGYSEGIAAGEGAVWVGTGSTVTRIDPKTNEVVARIPVGRNTWDRITVGAGGVWVLKMMDAMVYRIDPTTNQIVARDALEGTPSSVTSHQGFLWVSVKRKFTWGIGEPSYLMKIDPQRDAVIDRFAFPPEPYCSRDAGVELGGGANAIWAFKPARLNPPSTDARLWRIQTRSSETE